MKATKEDYEYFRTKIRHIYVTETLRNLFYSHGKIQGFESKRFRWDLSFNAGLTTYICDTLYKAGMNDSHVDTLLKKVVSELNEEFKWRNDIKD